MRLEIASILAAGLLLAPSCNQTEYLTDTLGVEVTAEENREYSYTDKKSGFWYGMTHQEEQKEWYSGWNIAKKRILADYTINLDGNALDRRESECTVYPDRLVRKWNNAVETFRLIDNLPIIHIELETDAQITSISIDQTLIEDSYMDKEHIFFIPKEAPDMRVMLGSDGSVYNQ